MSISISIDLSDEQFQVLQKLARENNTSVEELLNQNVKNWLTPAKDEFVEAADYILKKNEELYRRLA